MRVFKTKPFGRFARSEGISDAALREAVSRAEAGRIDADLGGESSSGALHGPAKANRAASVRSSCFGAARAYFVYGFAKSDRDNIAPDELKAFRRLAAEMFRLEDRALAAATANGTLTEVFDQ